MRSGRKRRSIARPPGRQQTETELKPTVRDNGGAIIRTQQRLAEKLNNTGQEARSGKGRRMLIAANRFGSI
jgi:hypothetical protein